MVLQFRSPAALARSRLRSGRRGATPRPAPGRASGASGGGRPKSAPARPLDAAPGRRGGGSRCGFVATVNAFTAAGDESKPVRAHVPSGGFVGPPGRAGAGGVDSDRTGPRTGDSDRSVEGVPVALRFVLGTYINNAAATRSPSIGARASYGTLDGRK